MTTLNLHGVEHLTQDSEGYVYWKGRHVEHYSFRDSNKDQEREAAIDLATRCRHLESLGVPVHTGTAIWHWGWFADRQPGDPWLPLLAARPACYEWGVTEEDHERARSLHSPGMACGWHPWQRPDGSALLHFGGDRLVYVRRGEYLRFHATPNEFGSYYDDLHRRGFNTARMGQEISLGTCYAGAPGVIAWFERHQVGVDVLDFVRDTWGTDR